MKTICCALLWPLVRFRLASNSIKTKTTSCQNLLLHVEQRFEILNPEEDDWNTTRAQARRLVDCVLSFYLLQDVNN